MLLHSRPDAEGTAMDSGRGQLKLPLNFEEFVTGSREGITL
jgi:hypothetical protein